MTELDDANPAAGTEQALDYDAIIIGAGMSGMYQLHRLRELGMRVRVFETGTGVGGTRLKERWSGGPRTFVGIMAEGFPNMFMVMGPHTALGNIPRSIEYNVEWVRDLIRHMRERDLSRADARPEAVEEWTDYVKEMAKGLLSNEVDSWMTGVNRNVDGKQTRILARYSGSAPAYRAWCDEVAAREYPELAFS